MKDLGVGRLNQGRSHKDIEFGDNRYSKKRKLFPWKKNEKGKIALCHMACFLRELGTDDQWVHASPKQLGVTGASIKRMLEHHYPVIFDEYRASTGKELTTTILMGRVGNMFRDNGTKTFCLGPEHPKQHKELQSILDEVWQQRRDQKATGGL